MSTASDRCPSTPPPRVGGDLDEKQVDGSADDVPSEHGADEATRRDTQPSGPIDEQKAAEILAACEARDRAALADHATSCGGLLSDDLRRRACTFFFPLLHTPPTSHRSMFHAELTP